MILICYDGSPDSKSAIDQAGELFKADAATILTVWVPFIDAASEQDARARADEGVERAKRVGLNAQPRTPSQHTTVADAIIAEAADVGASAIVIGTRGLTGLKSMMLGSVSHSVLHHAAVPVLVVPGAELAAARGTRR